MNANTELTKGDLIEHWERGIGRIVANNGNEVVIAFHKYGDVSLPVSQAEYLKKINSAGFLAHFYENENKLREIIAEASPEIVRLLIADEGSDRIERARIKQLLSKAPESTTGWRKDLSFVEDNNWSSWWSKVSKKITKDPSFNTSIKNVIALNKTNITPNVLKFRQERRALRKLTLAEQIIENYDTSYGEDIIKEISELVDQSLKGPDAELEAMAQAVVVYVKLIKRHLIVEISLTNEDAYILRTILLGDLAVKKSEELYKYLASKKQQYIYYHFLIYLFGIDEIRKLVLKNIGTLSFAVADSQARDFSLKIPSDLIPALEELSSQKMDMLKLGPRALREFDAACMKHSALNKLNVQLYLGILTTEGINERLIDCVSRHVADNNNNAVMLGYLNNLQLIKTPAVEILKRFVNALPLDMAVDVLSEAILISNIARISPALYETIIREIISGQMMAGITEVTKNKLCSQAYQNVPQDGSSETIGLKMRLATLLETQNLVDTETPFSEKDLVSMIENKAALASRRKTAVELLAAKNKKDLLMGVGIKLAERFDDNEWNILSSVLTHINEEQYARKIVSVLLALIVDKEIKADLFLKFIVELGYIESLVSVLIDEPSPFSSAQLKSVEQIINSAGVAGAFARRALNEVMGGSGKASKALNTLKLYYPEPISNIIDEACSILSHIKDQAAAGYGVLKDEHKKEVEKLEKVIDERVADAISKTKQRYEENVVKLKRTVALLDELKVLIDNASVDKLDEKWIKNCSNRIVMAEEDISLLMNKMGIV